MNEVERTARVALAKKLQEMRQRFSPLAELQMSMDSQPASQPAAAAGGDTLELALLRVLIHGGCWSPEHFASTYGVGVGDVERHFDVLGRRVLEAKVLTSRQMPVAEVAATCGLSVDAVREIQSVGR